MTGATFLHSLAAYIAWLEGQEHGTNGMLAILFCIRNRVAAGHEGGDLARILQAEYWYIDNMIGDDGFTGVPDVREPSFAQLLGFVEGVFNNDTVDRLTNGALYWGTNPFKGRGAMTRTGNVGELILWK